MPLAGRFKKNQQPTEKFEDLATSNLRMLERKILCDVRFIVGEAKEDVFAHRYMLVSRSTVFHSMFVENAPEKKDCIEVPDIKKEIFLKLLRFIYTGDVDVTAATALSLMYAANKFDITALCNKCGQYLKVGIDIQNVCTLLNQAHIFGANELKKSCLAFIFPKGKEVLQSLEFLALLPENVAAVIEADELIIAEEDIVYTSCIKWAKKECERRGIESNDTNKREVLGNIVYLIRFSVMGLEKFTVTSSRQNILTAEEKVSIYQQMVRANYCADFKFNKKERNKPPPQQDFVFGNRRIRRSPPLRRRSTSPFAW